MTWVGYLATTGLPTIDYRLTDARADPPGLADALHTEALWRLPRTAWCYRPYDEAPPPRRSPVAADGSTTFVSLNNPGKVNDTMLELWARVLQEVEGARLVLHVASQPSRVNGLERFFASRGIAAERLSLVGRQSIGDYLRTYAACDIALDTWPCAGGTTTCDALWMGVPVVTLAGTGSYSRTGASLLPNVGLGDLVADSADAYVDAVVRLARDTTAARRAAPKPARHDAVLVPDRWCRVRARCRGRLPVHVGAPRQTRAIAVIAGRFVPPCPSRCWRHIDLAHVRRVFDRATALTIP